jgi:hypothetical protein
MAFQAPVISAPHILIWYVMAALQYSYVNAHDIAFGGLEADVNEFHEKPRLLASSIVFRLFLLARVVSLAKLVRPAKYS